MCSSNFRIANRASQHHTIKVAESASEYTRIAVRIRQYLHQVADVSRANLTLPIRKGLPDARFGGARTSEAVRNRSSHMCLSAVVPAFAEPDIHSLSQVLADRHRRLSVCSLPVRKQFEESLRSLISLAQSATAGPGSLRAV